MTEESSTVNLKILSPSPEVEGGIAFSDIPATTTIKELRSRIQDAVPSKPAPERMRLIYRGRVVANDADTLGTVFGTENLRECRDQSLHLVLRELPSNLSTSSSPAPRSSTAPPNPFRPAPAPVAASPPLQTNPFRTIPQPRPNSQPQVPLPHHHHHHPHPNVHHHHHLPGPPPNPFQIPLPPAFQQHLAQRMAMPQNGQPEDGQTPNAQGQLPREGSPAPETGGQPRPMGLPPLPGFGPPNFPPNGRTVRQEGVGPNGERWSVTYSSTNTPVPSLPGQPLNLPRPFPLPPTFAPPPRTGGSPAPNEGIDRVLPRTRLILQNARQEMENVRTLLQTSGQQTAQPSPASATTPPAWRLERLRQHVQIMSQNLNLVEQGLNTIAADASMTTHPDVVMLRQSANELKRDLEELNRAIGSQRDSSSAQETSATNTSTTSLNGAPSGTPTPSSSSQPDTRAATQTLPWGAPEELFLLSSPQGPVGLLYDQRGTYMTAPMVPTLPFQTFTNQFAQNRQLIAGLGQQIAQGSQQWNNHLANIQPTPTQQPTPANQDQAANQIQTQAPGQARAQDQNHNQPQNQNQAPAQAQPANLPAAPQGENDRIANIFGHIWLVFKLACFVYFFSGGGGWYKTIVLALIAGGVYLAQLGVFEEHFNQLRRHFEAILPVGALAERAAQPRQARVQPDVNLSPEEAARRLLQQRQRGWLREAFETLERGAALFAASLWPGVGERMVRAQEERVRAERQAEEERVRAEEEKARLEAEEKEDQSQEKAGEGGEVAVEVDATGSSAKGKERADVIPGETEAESSGQA